MLPIKRIYIDTRQRTADSASHSDFSIDLPTTILMPDDTGFYVEDICLPISWWSVEEFYNDTLYMDYENALKQITLTPGNYTASEFGAEIIRAINSGSSTVKFAGSFRKSQGAIIIRWDDAYIGTDQVKSFKILTDSEMLARGVSAAHLKRSANNLLKNFTSGVVYVKSFPFTSGYVDMNPLRNAYLSCTGLGNFSTMSLTGDRNIIKQIPLNGAPGDIIYDSSQTGVDYLDCSRQTLSRISFQLKDNFGNILNLRGIHWSFSLVFSRIQNGI